MGRHLLTILSAVSLVLCLLIAALWVRSTYSGDSFGFRTAAAPDRFYQATDRTYGYGEFSVIFDDGIVALRYTFVENDRHPTGRGLYWEADSLFLADCDFGCTTVTYPLHGPDPYHDEHRLTFPLWSVIVICLAAPLMCLQRHCGSAFRRWRRFCPDQRSSVPAVLALVCFAFLAYRAVRNWDGDGCIDLGTADVYDSTECSWQLLGLRFMRSLGADAAWLLILPYWPFIGVACIPLLLWERRQRRARLVQHRMENRLCLHCGYDLRASNERCPECGTAIAVGEA